MPGSKRSTGCSSPSWASAATATSTRTRATAASTRCSIAAPAFHLTVASSTSRWPGAPACAPRASTFPATSSCARSTTCTPTTGDGLIVDPFHERRDSDRAGLPRAAGPHIGEEMAFTPELLARGHAAPDSGADAAQPEAAVRADGARSRRPAWSPICCWRCRRSSLQRAARSRPARLPHERLRRALRDLEEYLRLTTLGDADEEQRKETNQVWEHVKALRRRMASSTDRGPGSRPAAWRQPGASGQTPQCGAASAQACAA